MGCCSSCCPRENGDFEKIKEEGSAEGGSGDFGWEREFLEDRAMKSGFVSHSAIVIYPSGTLCASAPQSFIPNPTGIHDIISGLEGDTSGLEEHSVCLGGQTPVCTPGKIDAGKAIYCSDGVEGGCVAIRTRRSLLILFYPGHTDAALTLASELAEFMEESGR